MSRLHDVYDVSPRLATRHSEIIDRFVFSPEGKIRNRLIDLLPSVGHYVTGVEPAHRLLKNAEVCDGKPRREHGSRQTRSMRNRFYFREGLTINAYHFRIPL